MDISLDWLNKKKPGKTAEFLNLEYIDNLFFEQNKKFIPYK